MDATEQNYSSLQIRTLEFASMPLRYQLPGIKGNKTYNDEKHIIDANTGHMV